MENVRVMVRCRPLLEKLESNEESIVQVDEHNDIIHINGRQFTYDRVFCPASTSLDVYTKSLMTMIDNVLKGYNCTVFLYGQTGTGKTFTHSSIMSHCFEHIFGLIAESNKDSRFLVRASYYEVYNEEIRDFLAKDYKKPLELRESKDAGVYVKDLSCFLVNNVAELEKLKVLGDRQRSTAATKMNEHSSRSHSLFSITIEVIEGDDSTTSAVRVGKLHLVDLAGSERQSKTMSTGERLKESSKINLSLTCLSLVIQALTDPKATHVPYRNSKLTRLLSRSLGGNSKTLLIACIGPAKMNADETINTLRFASRTKKIKNKAVVNEDAKDALLRKYKRQIEELRHQLRSQEENLQGAANLDGVTSNNKEEGDTRESLSVETREANRDDRALADIGLKSNQNLTLTKEQSEIVSQLKALKAKIMVGGENLLEKAELHERLLKESEAELEHRRRKERDLKKAYDRKQQEISKMEESYGTIQEQVQKLNVRMKRAISAYKSAKSEMDDIKSEHNQLRDDLLGVIRSTNREIKLANCIIDNYIPNEFLELINSHAIYDSASEEWQIRFIAFAGNNTRSFSERLFEKDAQNNQPGHQHGGPTSAFADRANKKPAHEDIFLSYDT